MEASDIVVEVRGTNRISIGQLGEADLTDFICVPRMNTLGSWKVKLPDQVLDGAGLLVPHVLCRELRRPGAGLVVTGPNDVILSGPMLYAEQEQLPEDPEGTWTIEGVSDEEVTARALAYPNPNIADAQASSANRANDVRTANAETLLREYVSLNIGGGAPAARQVSGLTLDTDLGRGPILTKSPRFQNLLELLQEIAASANLLFSVAQVADGLELRVATPMDVSQEQRWDVENNQLTRAKYGFTAPTCTHVIVAGQGVGTERTIIEVTTPASLISAAIWGRIERFSDQRNTDDPAELLQAGLDILAAEGSAITSLEVVPSADMADGFGEKWRLGSLVTVVVGDQEIRAPVTEVPFSITAQGLIVGATVGDPVGFDWESVMNSRQSKLDSRMSALERS